jgi:hypothetical protein
MNIMARSLILLFALAITSVMYSQSARADGNNIGTLECFVASGSGFVIGSSKDISCTLLDLNDEPVENYIGEIKKYGVDIGFTEESVLVWTVFVGNGTQYKPGSLEGNFAGASASASLAVGLGASVLIGGLTENFALQPIRINRQNGVNIAVGITRMQLRSIKATQGSESNN